MNFYKRISSWRVVLSPYVPEPEDNGVVQEMSLEDTWALDTVTVNLTRIEIPEELVYYNQEGFLSNFELMPQVGESLKIHRSGRKTRKSAKNIKTENIYKDKIMASLYDF